MNAPILSCGQEAVGTLQIPDIDRQACRALAWIRAVNIPGESLHFRGLLLSSRLPQQTGVVDHAGGQIGMIGTKGFLLNGDGAAIERLGGAESALLVVGGGEVIEGGRYLR